jgi:nucleotide-binding universal stress UspA family protein
MENHKPNHILCAVRGRPASRATVSRAIELALESGARLTFLHILDAEFLKNAPVGPLSVVYQELAGMGEFAMLILLDRAQRRGVKEVDYLVREGNIHKQLFRSALETEADTIVIGQPKPRQGRNVFRPEEFKDLVMRLETEANLQVIQVPHDLPATDTLGNSP